ESPVPLPGAVVDGLEQRDLLGVAVHAYRPHHEPLLSPASPLGERREPRERSLVAVGDDREEVTLLHETARGEELEGVRGGVRHHDERRTRVALVVDERADLVVHRGIEGPAQPIAAGQHLARGTLGGSEQGARRLGVVLALEEAEERGAVAVDAVVLAIDDRGDPSDDRAGSARRPRRRWDGARRHDRGGRQGHRARRSTREEEPALRVMPEGILRRIERPAHVPPEWRGPTRTRAGGGARARPYRTRGASRPRTP